MSILFSVSNHHADNCGTPPVVTDAPGASGTVPYLSYFQNEHGEQWILSYDRELKQGVLRGGDIQWDTDIPIHTGWPEDVVLNMSESLWLAGALIATGAITQKEFIDMMANQGTKKI